MTGFLLLLFCLFIVVFLFVCLVFFVFAFSSAAFQKRRQASNDCWRLSRSGKACCFGDLWRNVLSLRISPEERGAVFNSCSETEGWILEFQHLFSQTKQDRNIDSKEEVLPICCYPISLEILSVVGGFQWDSSISCSGPRMYPCWRSWAYGLWPCSVMTFSRWRPSTATWVRPLALFCGAFLSKERLFAGTGRWS